MKRKGMARVLGIGMAVWLSMAGCGKNAAESAGGRCKIDEESSMEQRSIFLPKNRKAGSEKPAIRGIIRYVKQIKIP